MPTVLLLLLLGGPIEASSCWSHDVRTYQVCEGRWGCILGEMQLLHAMMWPAITVGRDCL